MLKKIIKVKQFNYNEGQEVVDFIQKIQEDFIGSVFNSHYNIYEIYYTITSL